MKLNFTIVRAYNGVKELEKAFRERVSSYIIAGFAFVAALAWNDAIKGLIEFLFPIERNTVFAKFIYAALLTLVLAFVTVYVVRLLKKEERKEEQR